MGAHPRMVAPLVGGMGVAGQALSVEQHGAHPTYGVEEVGTCIDCTTVGPQT